MKNKSEEEQNIHGLIFIYISYLYFKLIRLQRLNVLLCYAHDRLFLFNNTKRVLLQVKSPFVIFSPSLLFIYVNKG